MYTYTYKFGYRLILNWELGVRGNNIYSNRYNTGNV